MNGSSSCGTGVVSGPDGKLVVDEEGKARVWKEYFEGLGKVGDEDGKFDEEFREGVEEGVKRLEEEKWGEGCEELDCEFEEKGVRKWLARMKNGKAAGEDGVMTELLKGGGEAVVRALVMLFGRVKRCRWHGGEE